MTIQTNALTKLFVKSNLTQKKSVATLPKLYDYDWIVDQSNAPWINLKIDIPVDDIANEIKNNVGLLVSHRDEYGEHSGWKSFCIHGKSLTATQHFDDDRPFRWIPEIVNTMPRTIEYFQSWGLDFFRLRVMALEPGGYVGIHTDIDANVQKRTWPINIAITQPIDCSFAMEGWGIVPFAVGKSFMLDVSNRHAVINNSNETRYHIIVHYAQLNDKFKKIVENSYPT